MPHSDDRAAFKAGLFIFSMAVLAIVMVFLVRGFRGALGETQSVTVVFGAGDSAAALAAGSPVRIFGVDVGSVSDIRVVPDVEQGARVEVRVSLPAGFEVREDAEAIASASLTGESWLDFVTLGEGEPVEPEGHIRGGSGGIQQALDVVNDALPAAVEAVEQITAVSQRLDALIARLDAQVDPLMTDVSALAQTASGAARQLDSLLGDSGDDLRTTIQDFAQLARTTRERVPGLLDSAGTLVAKADATLLRVDPLLDRVGPVIGDTRAVVSDLRGLVRTNRAPVDRTVAALERTALDAEGAVAELRAAPWRVLYRPRDKDQRNLALYAAARDFASGAQNLEAAAEALQAALDLAPSKGALTPEEADRIAALQQRLLDSTESYEAVQVTLWQEFQR